MFREEADAVEGTQPCHTTEGVKLVESSLKMTLIGIVQSLFGKCKYRWVDATFPFTYPSWELEIFYKGKFSKAFFYYKTAAFTSLDFFRIYGENTEDQSKFDTRI